MYASLAMKLYWSPDAHLNQIPKHHEIPFRSIQNNFHEPFISPLGLKNTLPSYRMLPTITSKSPHLQVRKNQPTSASNRSPPFEACGAALRLRCFQPPALRSLPAAGCAASRWRGTCRGSPWSERNDLVMEGMVLSNRERDIYIYIYIYRYI